MGGRKGHCNFNSKVAHHIRPNLTVHHKACLEYRKLLYRRHKISECPVHTPDWYSVSSGPASRNAVQNMHNCPAGSNTSAGNETAFKACTSPAQYGSLADGPYTFSATCSDRAGNVATPEDYPFLIDTLPPVFTYLRCAFDCHRIAGNSHPELIPG